MLHLHRAASGRDLAAALGDIIRTPLSDPFAAEVVAVPARGVERWLTQQLSHRLGTDNGDGVCAHIDFPTPAALLDRALGVETGPWENTTWALVDLLGELGDAGRFTAVQTYLGAGHGRRYALASKVESLFARYQSDRPELVARWLEGDEGVPEDLLWQPELWRLLRAKLGAASPAERHVEACARLAEEPAGSDLPERLSVYGLSRISRSRLDVLIALARHRDVHLFVHHPGQALWDLVPEPTVRRADDRSALALANPLLASLSRDIRELQQRLLTAAPDLRATVHDSAQAPSTLLGRLQHELRTDLPPQVKELDGSVQVHACHGPARQVEVLREVLLRVLQDDKDLEPRDILVLVPDVETYAPLLAAAFSDKRHPAGDRLWVQIADRSPKKTNPMLGLAARLVELAAARVTGAEVLDLAGSPPVRRMFSLSDDALEQLRGWVVGSQIHWGLDGDHRARWQLGGLEHDTWRQGMDRLLAGVATQELVGGVLPFDGLDSGDTAALGRFAELVDRLSSALRSMQGAKGALEWLGRLEEAVLSLGEVPPDGQWQKVQLSRVFAGLGATDASLELADIAGLLDDALAGRPTRASFRTGALTVCTLTPMRSVPHKVVCLLGMDDASFPRHGLPDGDDLLARDPHLGERDARSEDRQLFLDALLAAEKQLIITYTGADLRTGAELPSSVPVGELLDVLPEGVVQRHPLQPFDARNFEAPQPFSFDPQAFAGAVAAQTRRDPLAPAPLGSLGDKEVSLHDLCAVLEHPGKGYLRQRLGVYASTRDDDPSDAIPLDLGGLPEWKVGDRVLRGLLDGAELAALKADERGRGEIPPGPLGEELLTKVGDLTIGLVAATAPYRTTAARVEVDVQLTGVRLLGAVPDVHGDTLLTVTYSSLGPKHRLKAWVQLLALVASAPDRPWTAVTIGKGAGGRLRVATLAGLSRVEAPLRLDLLLTLRDAALREPLSLPITTAAEYAEQRRIGLLPAAAWVVAEKKWKGDFGKAPGEREDDDWSMLGAQDPWTWQPGVSLPGTGYLDEPTPFAVLARRVWADLLDHESVNTA